MTTFAELSISQGLLMAWIVEGDYADAVQTFHLSFGPSILMLASGETCLKGEKTGFYKLCQTPRQIEH